MEAKNIGQLNGRNVLLWSLAIACLLILSTIGRFYLKTIFRNEQIDNLLYLPAIVFILWGILKGLSYKDNGKLSQHIAIKKSFRLILIGIAIFCLIFSIYGYIVDPIENASLITNTSRLLTFSSFVALSILVSFVIGIIPAFIARIIKIRFFANLF